MRPARIPTFPLALLLPLLSACSTGTMSGRVRDPVGNPVPQARLYLWDGPREPNAVTDSAGAFSIEFGPLHVAAATGSQVRVDAAGYHSRTLRLAVRESLEVVLVPDSLPPPPREWSRAALSPLGGLHYGIPLRLSSSIGVMRVRYSGFHDIAGWYLASEWGDGGFKGRIGYVRLGREFGVLAGPALLRTTAHARGAEPDQTWGGADTKLLAGPLTFGLGGYTHLSGNAPGKKRLLSFGVGMGL
jgi:hypothetical protein